MRFEGGRKSSNIDDRRGTRGGGGGAGIKLGGGAIVIVIVGLLMGKDPMSILQSVMEQQPAGGAETAGEEYVPTAEENRQAEFVALVLGDTEDTWPALLQQQQGTAYRAPSLVLFTDAVQSACGQQSAAVGPFYCPADEKVYIDLSFYNELSERFGAPGDFAQAYVIAHEVGHHIQHILGTSDRVHRARQTQSEEEANVMSVRLELQADCYAGVWAHHAQRARNILEAGDVEEGLAAAAAIGDDTLQRNAGRAVTPEAFTHGTSEQRVRWFNTGMRTGQTSECDTFAAQSL